MGSSIRVFVCYRRDDSRHSAARLADALAARFAHVFMDIETIAPGSDFTTVIAEAVSTCDVLLAVIGDHWTDAVDGRERRRLDDPDDFVALEIGTALERDILVVPVLIDGAQMPGRDDLPNSLKTLAVRQAHRLRHESFRLDAGALMDAIEHAVGGSARLSVTAATEPVWPPSDLLRIANSPVKSLVILQRILDLLSTEPGRRFDPDELERAVEAGHPPYTRSSMFNAIGKLGPHFRKHYRRNDLPFVREGEPGFPRFYVTPAQADAWVAVRGER